MGLFLKSSVGGHNVVELSGLVQNVPWIYVHCNRVSHFLLFFSDDCSHSSRSVNVWYPPPLPLPPSLRDPSGGQFATSILGRKSRIFSQFSQFLLIIIMLCCFSVTLSYVYVSLSPPTKFSANSINVPWHPSDGILWEKCGLKNQKFASMFKNNIKY